MNVFLLLLLLVIGLTWARLVRPGFNRLHGTLTLVVPLPLLARLRMHALPATFALLLAGILVVRGDVPWWAMLAPILSNVLLVAIPVKYTLTNEGIRLGWTSFHRWTGFAGVRRAPGGARLVGVQRTFGLHIWLSGSRGDDEFLQYLRQTVRNAYQGRANVVPFHGSRSAPDADSMRDSISAYTAER